LRDCHVQVDELGDTSPTRRSDDEAVGAGRCAIALDAAATGETEDQDTESRKCEKAGQTIASGAKPQQTKGDDPWERTGGDQSAGMTLIACLRATQQRGAGIDGEGYGLDATRR
jgi:hypothetical protein